MCGPVADGSDQLMNDGGDATLLLHKGKELKEKNAKSGFECAADEHTKRQAAEAAEQSLTSSRSNENEACQLQQDNKGFTYAACLTLLRLPMHLFLEQCVHAARCAATCSCRMAA